jgi:hypothetical protein
MLTESPFFLLFDNLFLLERCDAVLEALVHGGGVYGGLNFLLSLLYAIDTIWRVRVRVRVWVRMGMWVWVLMLMLMLVRMREGVRVRVRMWMRVRERM